MRRVPPVVAVKSGARHRPALLANIAGDINRGRSIRHMESFNLEPRYSTSQIPGKCIKCLAEQELNNCLVELLRGEGEDKEME